VPLPCCQQQLASFWRSIINEHRESNNAGALKHHMTGSVVAAWCIAVKVHLIKHSFYSWCEGLHPCLRPLDHNGDDNIGIGIPMRASASPCKGLALIRQTSYRQFVGRSGKSRKMHVSSTKAATTVCQPLCTCPQLCAKHKVQLCPMLYPLQQQPLKPDVSLNSHFLRGLFTNKQLDLCAAKLSRGSHIRR
jgi:hypothetical protein